MYAASQQALEASALPAQKHHAFAFDIGFVLALKGRSPPCMLETAASMHIGHVQSCAYCAFTLRVLRKRPLTDESFGSDAASFAIRNRLRSPKPSHLFQHFLPLFALVISSEAMAICPTPKTSRTAIDTVE